MKRGAVQLQIFFATIVSSSTLLFLVEPILAKALLPRFGGTAGVWNTCLLFFQTVLLIGYTYAWILQKVPEKSMADSNTRNLSRLKSDLDAIGAVASSRADGSTTSHHRHIKMAYCCDRPTFHDALIHRSTSPVVVFGAHT